jgi:peptidoglycan/xylan/chitin deacetylase (PgdA/CDA1 family)
MSTSNVKQETVIRHGACSGRRVFLTFDDGPDPRFTPVILDILGEAGAPATFFVVGRDAARHPALIRRIMAEGHTVGNHTWSHRHPWTMTESIARCEVVRASEALADLLGRPLRWFRPPHGCLCRPMMEEAQALGQQVLLWSLSGVDWGPWGRAARIVRRLHSIQGGDIVLLHDGSRRFNRPWETARVLAGFLSNLSGLGLRPSPLDALCK